MALIFAPGRTTIRGVTPPFGTIKYYFIVEIANKVASEGVINSNVGVR